MPVDRVSPPLSAPRRSVCEGCCSTQVPPSPPCPKTLLPFIAQTSLYIYETCAPVQTPFRSGLSVSCAARSCDVPLPAEPLEVRVTFCGNPDSEVALVLSLDVLGQLGGRREVVLRDWGREASLALRSVFCHVACCC